MVARAELKPGPINPGRIVKAGEQELAEQKAKLSPHDQNLPPSETVLPDIDIVVHVSPDQAYSLLDKVAKAAESSHLDAVAVTRESEDVSVFSFSPEGVCDTFQNDIIVR